MLANAVSAENDDQRPMIETSQAGSLSSKFAGFGGLS